MSTESVSSAGLLAGLSDELAGAVERAGKAVVAVRARRHVAAGGVVWAPGVVVTADHVIEQEEEIKIILADGKELPAKLAGRDTGTDIAVLRVDGLDTVAEIGASAALRVGHMVLAVARPGGEALAASIGIVSAISGSWRTWRGGQLDAMIRTDLTLYPGFSGGPLVDAAGRVVGINTSGLARGIALAIPTETINRVSDALLTRGHISRGYLGMGLQPVKLSADLAGKLSQEHGLMILSVDEEGPAAKAGVLIGDILVALDAQAISDTHEVQGFLTTESVGKAVKATIIRGGVIHGRGEQPAFTLTIGERK